DALVIAFLCAIESLSTAVVADGMAGTRHDSNQELVGQGIANLVSPLFGGLPGVGAIARTATGIQAGPRSPLTALVPAALVLLGLLLSAAIFLHRMSDMAHVELVDPKKDEHPFGHNVREEDIPEGVMVYSIDGPFFFGAADRFQETLARVGKAPKVVILRMRAV